MANSIWWIRRDLRLHDNQALHAAVQSGNPVIPLFILDPNLLASPYVGARRTAFLLAGLRALDDDLKKIGGRLIVRRGTPEKVLVDFVSEVGASAIYAEKDVSPYAQKRDARVQARIALTLTPGVSIVGAGSVLKKDGTPYRVYSPYNRSWQEQVELDKLIAIPAPDKLDTPTGIHSDAIPDEPAFDDSLPFPPGEAEAELRLQQFLESKNGLIFGYAKNRDIPAKEGTSGLSPYLRFGMISARRLAMAAHMAITQASTKRSREGAQTWLDELIWREFYQTILLHFPTSRRHSFNTDYDAILWDNNETLFEAWCQGRTGYPYIDAAMRQLLSTGWMHNRARMAVASFLIKDLLIDWRWGERWFMQQLLDGDPAANNGGWQWSAGSGPNAAPYFRIFNPISQGEKHDPQGEYVRRYVPELASVPQRYIHTPWEMGQSKQKEAGCMIGKDYPAPIVSHDEMREHTLRVYRAALHQDD